MVEADIGADGGGTDATREGTVGANVVGAESAAGGTGTGNCVTRGETLAKTGTCDASGGEGTDASGRRSAGVGAVDGRKAEA